MSRAFSLQVLRVDPIQDLVVGRSTFVWVYGSKGRYDAELTLCCRVSGHQNKNRPISLRTTVDLSDGEVGSPFISMLPIITLSPSGGLMQHIEVPANDAKGFDARSNLRYSFADQPFWDSLSTSTSSYPANSSVITGVDAVSGLLSVDLSVLPGGVVEDAQVVVVVTSGNQTAMVDFVVRFQPSGGGNVPVLTLVAPIDNPTLLGMSSSALRGIPAVEAFVDFQVVLTLRAQDADALDSVFFELSTPPAGAVVREPTGANPASLVVSWVPSPDQVGQHFVCAAVLDVDPATPCAPCTPGALEITCAPICPAHRRSSQLCFNVNVLGNLAPDFTLPVQREFAVDLNFPFRLEIEATNANWKAGTTIAPYGPHPEGSSVVPITGRPSALMFVWQPARHFGGGSNDVCFRAAGLPRPGLETKTTEFCMRVSVNPCRWYAGHGQSLDHIAKVFGSNYVQLWALNSDRESPDGVLEEGTQVMVGHEYQVRASDNFRYLSVQFATTRETLELLNYNHFAGGNAAQDIGEKEAMTMLEGQTLCILPHSCVNSAVASS